MSFADCAEHIALQNDDNVCDGIYLVEHKNSSSMLLTCNLSAHLGTRLIACLQTFQAVDLAWLHSNQLQLPNHHALYARLHDGVVQPQVQQEELLMQEVSAHCDL